MKNSQIRRTAAGAVGALVLAASVAGCSAAAPTSNGPATPDAPVDLTVTTWISAEPQLAAFQKIADAYVAANPALVASVTFDSIPFADYNTTLTTRIAGGQSPDVASLSESDAPQFLAQDALLPLTDTFSTVEGYDFGDISKASLERWTKDGEVYSYPLATTPQVLFVNEDLIAAAGVDDPRDLYESGDWTWDALREIAKGVHDSTGKVGLNLTAAYGAWQYMAPLWGAFGAEPWSSDYQTCEMDSDKMVDAFDFYHDMIYVDGSIPKPGTTADLFAGQAAMQLGGFPQVNNFDGSFNWDVLPLPTGPAGASNWIGQMALTVPAQSPHADIAKDFLAYFTNPENAAVLAQYNISPRESMLTPEQLLKAYPKLDTQKVQTVIDGLQDAQAFPGHPNFPAINSIVRGELSGLWADTADTEGVLSSICSQIQPLMTK